jgi:hypothetical protein
MPTFPYSEPGPLARPKEYGLNPACQSNTKEKSPPIGSVPLTPMLDWLIALGATPHIGDLFIFWM